MDKMGVQVSNKTGRVLANNGAQCFNIVTSTEKGGRNDLLPITMAKVSPPVKF